MTPRPELIAHRGYTLHYPENTLIAIEHAVRAGARYVEFDVNLCADGTPVLSHDADLKRMAGVDQRVTEISVDEIKQLHASEAGRFGGTFAHNPFATLQEIVSFLATAPQVLAFVEVKRASLAAFGVAHVMDRILATIAPIRTQCVIISFDEACLRYARTRGAWPIGWVFEPWNDNDLATAFELKPEYVFTDYETVPANLAQLPQGGWRWALYEIADAQLALSFAARGAHMIETFAIGEMRTALR